MSYGLASLREVSSVQLLSIVEILRQQSLGLKVFSVLPKQLSRVFEGRECETRDYYEGLPRT